MTPGGRSTASDRIPGLDGLRYLAAALIVLHHAGFASNATFATRAGPYLARMDVGVAIFFVLSGYLLYRPIVLRQLQERPPEPVGRYYLKRVARIYPAYWVALWLTLVLGGSIVGDATGLWHTSALTHVYVPERSLSGLTQSWSLAAEVAFYLALPALGTVAWAVARRAPAHLRPGRLLLATGVLYAGSVAFRIVVERTASARFEGVMHLWMPAQIDHFALGMALAVLAAWAEARPELQALVQRVFTPIVRWWAVGAAVFWFTSTQLDLARGLERAGDGAELLRQGLYGLVAVALVAPLALCPHQGGRVRRLLDSPVARWLGGVSYGLYLWHLWFINRLPGWRDFPLFSGHFLELAAAGLVLGTAAAALSQALVERPVNDLVRRRLVHTNPLGTTEVPVG